MQDRSSKDETTGLPRADVSPLASTAPLGAGAAAKPAPSDGATSSPVAKSSPVAESSPVLESAAPSAADAARTGLPSMVPTRERDERGGVFRDLVSDDADITGLVAYSIYKQNKLDWLNAFEADRRRAPTSDELAAYIIGEGTPRRLATYRHLAEATLAGRGPEIGDGSPAPRINVSGRRGRDATSLPAAIVASYALVAMLLLVIFLLLARYMMAPR